MVKGIDDFEYLATQIGDSIKRELKKRGAENIQGEFGIGLLSFRTVWEQLTITSCGKDNNTQLMVLMKNNPGYGKAEADRRGTENRRGRVGLEQFPRAFQGGTLRADDRARSLCGGKFEIVFFSRGVV